MPVGGLSRESNELLLSCRSQPFLGPCERCRRWLAGANMQVVELGDKECGCAIIDLPEGRDDAKCADRYQCTRQSDEFFGRATKFIDSGFAGREHDKARAPRSAAFHAAYASALAGIENTSGKALADGSIAAMIRDFKKAPEYTRLGSKTQRDYTRHLDHLGLAIGPFQAGDVRRTDLIKLRNKIAVKVDRTADLFVSVVCRCFRIGMDLGYVETNPAAEIGRINTAESYVPWTAAQRTAFESSNPPQHLYVGYMLSLLTSLRLGDVLRLARTCYDGTGFGSRGKPISPCTLGYQLFESCKTDGELGLLKQIRLGSYCPAQGVGFVTSQVTACKALDHSLLRVSQITKCVERNAKVVSVVPAFSNRGNAFKADP